MKARGAEEAVVQTRDPSRANSLMATFARRGDRYGHVIELVHEGLPVVPLLRSVEGGDVEPFPPSPPLQQLAAHSPPDQQRATLLLGMAGRSHWSMSVEPREGAIVFDVACRVADVPTRLGSQYRLLAPEMAVELSDREARLPGAWGEVRFELLPIDGQPAALLRRDDAGLRLDVPWTDAALPATIRWKYRLVIG